MNKLFGISLSFFFLVSVLAAYALPTMAGTMKSYNGETGIMVLELEDKSEKKFKLTEKTKVEWMGRTTAPSALRKGAKISIQIAGALNASPLKAAKIVDWGNSGKIVAKKASAPYHTPVAQFASTAGGGGVPDGAPKMDGNHHQTMATIGHGGSQNQPHGPQGQGHTTTSHSPSTSHQGYPNSSGQYVNQGASMTAPLEGMGIDPYSTGGTDYTQMGANDIGNIIGGDESGTSSGMNGMEAAYGGATERMTGRVMESAIEQGFVIIQSFEHPTLQRILLQQAGAPTHLLVQGQMIEVVGTQSPQGFRATEIKPANGF